VFSIIKYAGALYLVYLGIRTLMKKRREDTAKVKPALQKRTVFFQGMLTNVLNPKVAIFFLSFLPQFVDPASPYVKQQIAFLGLWFDVQGALFLMVVALIVGRFKEVLRANTSFWKWQEKITGSILVALGVKMLVSRK